MVNINRSAWETGSNKARWLVAGVFALLLALVPVRAGFAADYPELVMYHYNTGVEAIHKVRAELSARWADDYPGETSFRQMPLVRLNQTVPRMKNACVFGITPRGTAEQGMYRVLPLMSTEFFLYSTSGKVSFEDGSTVLVVRGGASHKEAERIGLAVKPVRSPDQVVRMLKNGRAIYWFETAATAEPNLKASGTGFVRGSKYRTVRNWYLACSRDTDEVALAQIRSWWEGEMFNGTARALFRKYGLEQYLSSEALDYALGLSRP